VVVARRPAAACTALAVYGLAVRLAPPSALGAAEKTELLGTRVGSAPSWAADR
jgi:hypothetical protein